jgi:hypothetical protein
MAATTTLPYGPAMSLSSTLHNDGKTSMILQGWAPEPQTRGTWSLLYSCSFTIALCVWTAIHPNIPACEDSTWATFGRKFKWVLVALFIPEMVLSAAWQQLYRSWRLRQYLNKAFDAKAETERAFNSEDKARQLHIDGM